MTKILLIDVGNTFGKLVLYDFDTSSYSNLIRISLKNVQKQVETILESSTTVSTVLVSSTVPASYVEVKNATSKFHKVKTIKLDHTIILKRLPRFSVAYDVNKLGSDRLIVAAGAFTFMNDSKLNAEGGFEASIVVDAGTAVNVEVILRDKGYIGGSISPGFRLMKEALCSGTAQLPSGADSEVRAPPTVGTCTLECIASGVYSAVCGGVYDVVSRICCHGPLKDFNHVRVILTGGDCGCLLKHLKGNLESNVPNVKSVTSEPLYVLKSMQSIFAIPLPSS
eukprot:g6584.t1